LLTPRTRCVGLELPSVRWAWMRPCAPQGSAVAGWGAGVTGRWGLLSLHERDTRLIASALLATGIVACSLAEREATIVPRGPCDVEAAGTAYLSSPVRPDHVSVAVRGPTCDEATFSIEIRTDQDEIVYVHSQGLLALLAASDSAFTRSDLEASARLVVERTVAADPPARASELPEFREGDFEFDANGITMMGQVLVPRKVYERIRTANQPVFDHVVGPEAGRFVAVDPQTQKVVAILDAWL
jgi:hypothetical protein